MARIRIPTAKHEASGAFDHDPQRRRARENEPVPAGPLGDPPEHLTRSERSIWTELSLQVPEGVLTVADRMFMEVTCALMARHRASRRSDEDERELLKAAEYNLLISCLARMGMTPSDRSRVAVPPKPPKNKFAKFNVQ